MDNDLRELQKQEAMSRLRILQLKYGVMENVINEFEQDDTIYYSENINKNYQGVLYWLSNEEQYVNAVKRIEEESNIFVYHCILNYTEFGKMLSMLYVSKYQEEWETERKDLLDGNIMAYVHNIDDGRDSEFGSIEIEGVNGGLNRIY